MKGRVFEFEDRFVCVRKEVQQANHEVTEYRVQSVQLLNHLRSHQACVSYLVQKGGDEKKRRELLKKRDTSKGI